MFDDLLGRLSLLLQLLSGAGLARIPAARQAPPADRGWIESDHHCVTDRGLAQSDYLRRDGH